MIKKKIQGMSPKEILQGKAKNKLYNFLMDQEQIRCAIVHGTHMIHEMRASHELGILETLVLGHAYLGAALMTANLKGHDRIAIKIDCTGPIQGLSVEANAYGEVRGYLKNNPIPVSAPLDSFDLSPFFGEGTLTFIRYPEFAKQPYTGQVNMIQGSIASNLTNYFWVSEQIPTAFHVSIKFDSEGNVTGAGGLFLQALPGADSERTRILELLVQTLPSIGEAFSTDETPEMFINNHFHGFSPRLIADRRIEFYCQCKKETIAQIIEKLPVETLTDIVEKGPIPLETHCHNCNTVYQFDKEEILGFLRNKTETPAAG